MGYILLLAAFLIAFAGVGVYVLVELPGWIRRKALDGPTTNRERRIAAGGFPSWLQGDDLLSYPSRLEQLESRLTISLNEAGEQIEHLRMRRDRIAAKDDRGVLAQRYEADATMLERRVERMCRVLALVWRTRAILLLRAHVAITARRRPALESLPGGEIPAQRLQGAAGDYDRAAAKVRAFVAEIDTRETDLHLAVPMVPEPARPDDDDREAVETELARARETYQELGSKLDRLADTLAYLGDRCRTRLVVEGAPTQVEAEPGTEQLVDEVNTALTALNDLAELGDRQLADSAMDNLAEGISQLEKSGLEAQAEAEAVLEVARLLEQFPA